MFRQIATLLWRTLCFAALLLAFFITMELIRSFLLIYRINPIAGWVYGGFLFLAASVAIFRFWTYTTDRRTLSRAPVISPDKASHQDLKRHCVFLIRVLKRMGENHELDEETRQKNRQCAYDIEDLFASHPLNEDLQRSIAKAEQEVLQPTFELLKKKADDITHAEIVDLVKDVFTPPFPTVKPVAFIHHQIALVSRIVDIYIERPALYEYAIVLRDVCRVVTQGNFSNFSQTLFQSIYAMPLPLGRALDDFGQALTSIWLTKIVSETAILRCESLRDWQTESATVQLERKSIDALSVTRDILIKEILPEFKMRIRHSAPSGTADTTKFTDDAVEGVIKAIDAVMMGLRARSTNTVAAIENKPVDTTTPSSSKRHHKHKHRRKGMTRVFQTFVQRIKYTVHGPRMYK